MTGNQQKFVFCPLSSDIWSGGVAQLGERLLCKQEVVGSIPITSTKGAWHQGAWHQGAWHQGAGRAGLGLVVSREDFGLAAGFAADVFLSLWIG